MSDGRDARPNATKPRQREPKMKAATGNILKADVLARGAEEVDYSDAEHPGSKKGAQRPSHRARRA